jgi:predicted enzyme involved in methoxymalonyl-ACP biosynthesis
MSCRVMGRLVENAFLAFLLETAVEKGAVSVRGVYRPTGKNHVAEDFYARMGFAAAGFNEDGECRYELDLSRPNQFWPEHIRRAGAEAP